MAISAKPTSYTVNTAHAHCPDHLWMIDEGSGTTLDDKGKTGGYDLTLTDTSAGSGPEWTTDATHGTVLDFVAANGDRAQYSSVSGLTGVHVIGAIVKGTAGASARCIATATISSAVNKHCALYYQGDEDVEAVSRLLAETITAASTADLTLDWDFVAMRFSDSAIAWSLNGSAWSETATTHTGLITTFDRIALGALAHSSPSSFWDDNYCAAMWWKASKSDAEIASIASDPWQFLSTTQAFQYQSRINPLLRM